MAIKLDKTGDSHKINLTKYAAVDTKTLTRTTVSISPRKPVQNKSL